MYKFTKPDNWEEIGDFLAGQVEAEGSFEKEILLSGYSFEPVVIGDPKRSSLSLEIYRKSTEEASYDFIAVVDIGGTGELVAIPTLPDLLSFLKDIVPLGIQIDTLTMMKEQKSNDDQINLSPTYY